MNECEASQSSEPLYVPFTVVMNWREIDTPIMLRGKKVTCYRGPVITEYVDTCTGEILEATELRKGKDKNKELWPELHASERCLQREFILNSLRPEVREFALFVLRFRNQRRGVTPGFDRLVRWYAELAGKRADNVRRYIKPLEKVGIIAGDSLLGSLFQITGNSVSPREHLCEDSTASSRLGLMRVQQRVRDSGIEIGKEPGWVPFVTQFEITHNAVLHPILPACIRELISRYVLEHPEPLFA